MKRIDELGKEAADYAAAKITDGNGGGYNRFNAIFQQRFAELVVRECHDAILMTVPALIDDEREFDRGFSQGYMTALNRLSNPSDII